MILTTLTPVYYPNWIGNRQVFVGTGYGPASYSTATGDILTVSFVPFNIDSVLAPVISVSGNYIVIPKPVAVGKAGGWALFWYNFSTTGTPAWTVASGNLSAEQVQIAVVGGP